MKRMWLQAEDGTYYRNCPLISEEQRQTPFWRIFTRLRLEREWRRAFQCRLTCKKALGPGDVVVDGMAMREGYPA